MNDPFSTAQYIKRGLYIFLAITALGLLYATAQHYLAPSDGISDPAQLDYGLEDSSAVVTIKPTGYLYLYGVPVYGDDADEDVVTDEESPQNPDIYSLAVGSNELRIAPLSPAADIISNQEFVPGFYMGYDEEAIGTSDEYHPAWINYVNKEAFFFGTPSLWNEGDVQSPGQYLDPEDRPWVAYDGQPEELAQDSTEYNEIDNWQVVLRNEYTDETRIIENAARPIWINGGADLLYLKEDGIYRYNLAAAASDLVDGSWDGLLRTSDLAVASDNSALVLTVPALNTIAVYTFTDAANGELLQQGMIASENTTYTAPVFSPDNRMYAVMAFNSANFDEAAQRYTTGTIEFRPVYSREVVEVLTPPLDFMEPIALVGWRSGIEPYELR